MEHVIVAIQFLIDGNWVVLQGWEPRVVTSYEICEGLAKNAIAYVKSNPHPTATHVMVGCYALITDSVQMLSPRS